MLNIVLGYADTDPFDKVETFEFKPGIVPIENTDLNKALETVKNTVTNAPSSTSTSTPFDKVETFEFKPGIVPIENTDLNKALETVKNTVTNAPSSTSTSTEPGIITEAKKYAKMSGLTLTQFFLLLVLLTMLLLLIFKD